jgi:hypothetical protein
MNADARGCLGTVYGITSTFLAERKLLDDVKARLSPSSRMVLEKPPFALSWQPSAPLEEIEKLLYARSPELVVDLGHAAGRQLSGTLVAPVLKMALSMFGQTPATMFGHLDRFFSMAVRGFSFQYEPRDDKSGTVAVQIEGGGVHRSLFEQVRGNLLTVYDLCNVKGDIGGAEVLRHDEAGAEIRLPVRWA